MFCVIYRWRISSSRDHGLLLGPAVRKHLVRCRACREFQEQMHALEQGLRPAEPLPAVPEALRTKVLRRCRAVSSSGRAARHAVPLHVRHPLVRPALALAAAAVLVAIGLAAIVAFRAPARVAPVAPQAQFALHPFDLIAHPLVPPAHGQEADQAMAEPMEQELEQMAADGRAAADHLLACVPFDVGLPAEVPTSQEERALPGAE